MSCRDAAPNVPLAASRSQRTLSHKRRELVKWVQFSVEGAAMTGRLVRTLFGRFQNPNLLVLREDLRRGDVTQGDWSSIGTLCPLAHGLSAGRVIGELRRLSQAINLEEASVAAAKCLGVLPVDVYQFVRMWDDSGRLGVDWLAQRLDELWAERLADADCVQEILTSPQTIEFACLESAS